MKIKAPLLLLVFLAGMAQGQTGTPTWSDDIACIVYSHCTPCHRSEGPGHFELITYPDAYYWRNEMMWATSTRFMPPWPPDPEYNSLAHERTLTQEEIDLIAAWVAAGAPEGDPAAAPPPPVFNSALEIPDPDLTAIMDDFVIPASTNDLYRCFVLEVENPVDRFITAMEVIPGNSSMVHHVLVFQDTTGQARLLDDADMGPGYTSFGGIGVSSAKLIGAWVPGERAFHTPPGMGLKLFSDADIVIQVHYPATGVVEVDSTRLNMLMSDDQSLRELSIDAVLEHGATLTNGPLIIPPNEVKSFHSQFTVPFPATIVSIAPHAHLVCTTMRSYGVLPSGDTIPFIDIPRWDFRWQGHYSFRNPIFLPAGTVLHGEATYDNTADNPFNPNSPPQYVFLGEATTNEMMLFYFAWTLGMPSDANIVIDTSEHQAHHLDCMPSLVGVEETSAPQLDVWPTPAHDRLWISHAGSSGVIVRVLDLHGAVVLEQTMTASHSTLDVGHLARSVFVVEVVMPDGGMGRRKIVLE